MRLAAIAGAFVLLIITSTFPTVRAAAPPNTCAINQGYYEVSSGTVKYWVCTDTNTWKAAYDTTASSTIPSGLVTMILSGTCPVGWSEATALNGRMLRGTLAANADVGQTGGADAITPTVASLSAAGQAITGSVGAEAAHTHSISAQVVAWPASVPTIGIGTFVNVATATTGNCAATNVAIGTGATNACKATAPNLTVPAEGHSGSLAATWPVSVPTTTGNTSAAGSSHTHTVGTLANAPSTVSGTLNAFNNRPAYTNVIFCSKN